MQVWRICKREYVTSSFSGQGGLLASGRWHRKGSEVVYTAQSLALAALEVWVHVAPNQPLPHYVAVPASIPEDVAIQSFGEDALPAEWRKLPALDPGLQQIGTDWLVRREAAVLRLPSAVIPAEFNFLLNPLHPDFARIQTGEPVPFEFDRRMWKQGD